MKKRFLLSSILILIFAITSCGGGDNNDSSNGGIVDKWWETTGELQKDKDGNVIFDNVTVDLTTVVAGEDLATFMDLIDQFNREYSGKIFIIAESVNQAGFESNIASRIANNSTPPDLIMSHQKGHASFLDNKLIQPFDEAYEALGIEINLSNFMNNLAKDSKLGTDMQFQIPIDAQSIVVYYNQKLLDKYGESLPETRDEFITLCRKVQAGERASGKSSFYGATASTELSFWQYYLFPTAVLQNGGSFYDIQTYRANWTEPNVERAFLDAFHSLRQMYEGPNAIMKYGEASDVSTQNFIKENALFYFGMPWNANSIFQAYREHHNPSMPIVSVQEVIRGFSTAYLFALDETSPDAEKIFGDSHAFALSKSVKDIEVKAAVVEFINWFTTSGYVGAAWAEAGHITASHIIKNSEEYSSNVFVNNYIENFYLDLNSFVTPGNTPYFNDTFNRLYNLGAQALNPSRTKGESYDKKLLNDSVEYINGIIDLG